MGNFGRPATKPAKMMDGFYIEVANKGSKIKGVKIRNESRDAMELAASQYAKNKEVTILGEYRNEAWVDGK